VWSVLSDRNFTHRDRKGQFGLDDLSIRGCPFLSDLCDLRVKDIFSDRNLHTEIAKATKTDLDKVTLKSVVGPFLCVLCDLREKDLF
jgi:hypothetical protein